MQTEARNILRLKSGVWGQKHAFSGYGVSAVIAKGPECDDWLWDKGNGLMMLGIITKNVHGIKRPFTRFESYVMDRPIMVKEYVHSLYGERERSIGGTIRYKDFFKQARVVDNVYEIDGETILERQYWMPPKNTHNLVGWAENGPFVQYEKVDGYYHARHGFIEVLGDLLQKNVGLPFDDYIVKKLAEYIQENPFTMAWGVNEKAGNTAIDLVKSYSKGIEINHWRMTYSYPRLVEVIGRIVAERYRQQ